MLALAASVIEVNGAAFDPVLINGRPAHPTRILAREVAGSSLSAHALALADNDLSVVRDFALVPGLAVLEIDRPAKVMSAHAGDVATTEEDRAAALMRRIEALRASGLYEFVEPDYYVKPCAVPTDSSFTNGTLWGLRNTGQSDGTAGVDIDAVRAWDITTGSTSVVVAVIDSGIRYTHHDLSAQMWKNPGEIAGNGVDDDHDGYVDDVYGIDAVAGTGDPMDTFGHGTHVAGTIGATANGGGPHVGVAWNVRLMACKFFDESEGGTQSDLIECYEYAVQHGAKIINCSFGGSVASISERLAIEAARDQGVLVVAAAGNDGVDSDFAPNFPSAYDLDNVIAVAAIDRNGHIASFSNYGSKSVDLGAPGVDIYSTYNGTDTAYFVADGTSMAAPHVAGVAALVRARFPGISVWDLRDRILGTTTPTGSLSGRTLTGGTVNAYQALAASDDGALKLEILPASGTALIRNRATTIVVRVRDLAGVTGATVTGSFSGIGSLTFRDDGVEPDAIANDARYTTTVTPTTGTSASLTVNASAPGKTSASRAVTYTVKAPPSNDSFASGIVLDFINGSTTGSNIGGTLESGEPKLAGEVGGASVWWRWTAPQDTAVTVSTEGSDFDTLLGVFTGSSVNALTEIASNDDIDGPGQPSRVVFNAKGGTTYLIVVDGWEGITGDIKLSIATTLPPENDDFADAFAASGSSFSVTGSNLNGTREGGEPIPPKSNGEHSVWWTWTAPSTGVATIRAQSEAFASDVSVYSGTAVSNLTRCPGRYVEEEHLDHDRITFSAIAHQVYHFAVSSISGDPGGDYTLSLSMSTGPGNDLFADAIEISGTDVTVSGNNTNGTREPGEPPPSIAAFYGGTIWWKWTAPSSGTVTITPEGSSAGDLLVSAYSGSSVSSLILVAARDESHLPSVPPIKFPVVEGVVYHLAADISGNYASPQDITFHFVFSSSPQNDLFANRIELVGASVRTSGTTRGAARESGEPVPYGFLAGTSIWWEWTSPLTGTAEISVSGSSSLVLVYTGDTFASMELVRNSRIDNASGQNVRFHTEQGTAYQIEVDGYMNVEGAVNLSIETHDAPPNDLFSDRVELSGSPVVVKGTDAWATLEQGEPNPDRGGSPSTVWWTWTAPADGTVSIDAKEEGDHPDVYVYTGSHVNALTRIPTMRYPYAFRFPASAGSTYQIAVTSDNPSLPSAIDLSLSLLVSPGNDLFANRSLISGDSAVVNGSIYSATREAGEPYLSGSPYAGSSWWTWTPSSSGTACITSEGSEEDAMFGVYTGGVLSGLQQIAVSLGGNRAPYRWAYFPVTAGTTYQISVEGESAYSGNVRINVAVHPPPENDAFSKATVLSGMSVVDRSSSVGATHELNEPRHGYNLYDLGASVWWTWTAPGDGIGMIDTSETGFAHAVAVYTGERVESLVPVYLDNSQANLGKVSFAVESGTQYRIVVEGLDGAFGDISLAVSLHAPPENDPFAARTLLAGTDVNVTANNLGATPEPDDPHPDHFASNATLWWTWTAPRDGTARVGVSGAAFDAKVGVFTGGSLSALTAVVANVESNGAWVFHAFAGTVYQIVVDSSGDSGGEFVLGLSLIDAPANDMFADRIEIEGSSAIASGSITGATREEGEDMAVSPSGTLWWSWAAPEDGRMLIRTGACDFGPGLTAFVGNTLGDLSAVVYGSGSPHGTGLFFDASKGTIYYIALNDSFGEGGDFSLEFLETAPPPNDDFANRTVLTGSPVTVAGSTLGADSELGEPPNPPMFNAASDWWSWTASESGRTVIELGNSDPDFLVVAYTGDAVDALTAIESRLFRTDDGHGVVFDALAGTTYQIAVVSEQITAGDYELTVAQVVPPPNDRFADRIALSGSSVTVTGSDLWAGLETGDPEEYYFPQKDSVWWSWTAPSDGLVVVSTRDSPTPIRVGAYTGISVEELAAVDYNSYLVTPSNWTRCAFFVTEGQAYQLRVSAADIWMGDLRVDLDLYEPPGNDQMMNAETLSGETVEASGSNLGASREDWEANGNPNTVWWSWTAPSTGPLIVSTLGSAIDTALTVYADFGSDMPDWLASNDNAADDVFASELTLDAVAGTTYFFQIFGNEGESGAIDLHLYPAIPHSARIGDESESLEPGSSIQLVARAEGAGPFEYQWFHAGVAIEGATNASFAIPCAQLFDTGFYAVRVSNVYGNTVSETFDLELSPPPLSNARLLNLSTRAMGMTGENALIPGFVIGGSGKARVLLRAVGPQLGQFGVEGSMPDPQMVLKQRVGERFEDLASNDNWGTSGNPEGIVAAAAQVGAFPLLGEGKDAALLVDLNPGPYTVVADDATGASGIAMVELYEVPVEGGSPGTRLVNISNRGFVGRGASVMIPGFVISNEGPKTVLLRAVGPQLADFGVNGVLADPRLNVYRANQVSGGSDLILNNDNWGENGDATDIAVTEAQVGAFALDPGSKDAAFVVTLQPGAYTAIASGADGGTGVALVEVYIVE